MVSRILIIEDNPDNLKLMSYLLSSFGHKVLTAPDGEEGLTIAERESLDLIVCDIQLPKIDGYEVARHLKANESSSKIPLIAVTALAMVGDRDKILAAGFDGYISKPIVPRTFVSQVEAFLGKDPVPLPKLVAQPSVEAPTPIPARRGVILVVDNTALNIELFRRIFEPFGYEVVASSSIEEAMAALRVRAPDIIVSDLHLSRESGHDLVRLVKADKNFRNIPYVFLSSTSTHDSELSRGLALGADKFLVRPISPQKLIAEVEECIKRHRES